MRVAEPFRLSGEHLTIELRSARVLFTTRRGGYSTGRYESLNLGSWTDDDSRRVERNLGLLERQLNVRLAYGHQVHGTRVNRSPAPPDSRARQEEADGQATALAGCAPMVLTADCLPIALAGEGAVAMLHAGWRGLAAGILAAGMGALQELGVAGELSAAIGPGAGPCCYEVGEEVHEAFAMRHPSARRGSNLDLKAIARRELTQAGVEPVHDVGLCTICAPPSWFYSYRRDGGITGRQAGIAWLT